MLELETPNDVAQHLAHFQLQLRSGKVELFQPRALRVSDAGQEICNWISHAHTDSPTSST